MNINNDVFYDLKYILQNISNNTEKLELFFDESPYAIINEEYFYKILNNLPIGIKILTIIYFEHPNNKYLSLIKKPFGCTVSVKYNNKIIYNL